MISPFWLRTIIIEIMVATTVVSLTSNRNSSDLVNYCLLAQKQYVLVCRVSLAVCDVPLQVLSSLPYSVQYKLTNCSAFVCL